MRLTLNSPPAAVILMSQSRVSVQSDSSNVQLEVSLNPIGLLVERRKPSAREGGKDHLIALFLLCCTKLSSLRMVINAFAALSWHESLDNHMTYCRQQPGRFLQLGVWCAC